jgi:hypothetical protein
LVGSSELESLLELDQFAIELRNRILHLFIINILRGLLLGNRNIIWANFHICKTKVGTGFSVGSNDHALWVDSHWDSENLENDVVLKFVLSLLLALLERNIIWSHSDVKTEGGGSLGVSDHHGLWVHRDWNSIQLKDNIVLELDKLGFSWSSGWLISWGSSWWVKDTLERIINSWGSISSNGVSSLISVDQIMISIVWVEHSINIIVDC